MDDKFIQRANGESVNVDARERAGGETLTKAGIRGEKVKGIECEGDERKERVNGVELRMRRNKREREGTSQGGEWEMPETNVGKRQILRREEKGNNELRMEARKEKDERRRQSDRKEKSKTRGAFLGRKLEREISGERTKTGKEETRKEKNTERDEKEEKEDERVVEEKRKDLIRKEVKPLDRKEEGETLDEQEKEMNEIDKREEREDEEEKNTMKQATEKIEGQKTGSRTVDVEKNPETVVMKNLRKLEGDTTGNNTKDTEEKVKTERVTKKTEQGNSRNNQEEKITTQMEDKKDKERNKTTDGNEKTKTKGATTEKIQNKNETRMEKLNKENRRGEKKGEEEEGKGGGEEEAAAVFFLRALKEKGREKNASEKLLTIQGVKGKRANAINISSNEGAKQNTHDKFSNMTKERTGESANSFSPAETKEEENKEKENKVRWNVTMDRSTNKRHKRSNNVKERDENDREVMVLKEMKRELEKQIKRREKQAENKREKQEEERKFVKFGMGGKNDSKTLGMEEMKKTKKKEEEMKLKQSQNMALRKDLAHLLREKQEQAREKTKRKEQEDKLKKNLKIKPRKYNTERNLKNWIGDEKINGMGNKEGKEEKRKKRKKLQEKIGKATFKFLTEGGKVEGKEKTGEGNLSASVLKSDILKALNVTVANKTWEEVKREIKEKKKERKMNKKMKEEADQRQGETERMLSSAGTEENDEKKEIKENSTAGGVTDEKSSGNKTDDEKSTQGGKKSVNKAAYETKPGDQQEAEKGQAKNVTKASKAKDTSQTQVKNKTEEEEQGAKRRLLPPALVLTHNSSSPKYLLPTWECALSLIGVKANSYVMVSFQEQVKEDTSIILHLQREWTPEEVKTAGVLEREAVGPGGAGETVLEVSGPSEGVGIVAREAVVLRADTWTFFSVFRKDRVFAVFRAGHQLPLLVYVTPSTATPFIPDLRLVQVWSKGDAEWDLLGENYRGENDGREPKDPAIRKELTEVRNGLTSRLGVAAVLQEHGWRPDDDDPRLVKYKTLRENLATLRPFKTLLQYYGRVGSTNDSWHDAERVRRFVATRNIDSVLH
ncbi:hypothetical protein E2C01_035063 [Portunus trituberculatus]|uniref:Uncharacterized protein n=1 Tax=Portunus trituberculatus TaxID=210409 RepID=A0A5B7F361_PORTR|nr:hypothetical protein [Portunus trituberculatus]